MVLGECPEGFVPTTWCISLFSLAFLLALNLNSLGSKYVSVYTRLAPCWIQRIFTVVNVIRFLKVAICLAYHIKQTNSTIMGQREKNIGVVGSQGVMGSQGGVVVTVCTKKAPRERASYGDAEGRKADYRAKTRLRGGKENKKGASR